MWLGVHILSLAHMCIDGNLAWYVESSINCRVPRCRSLMRLSPSKNLKLPLHFVNFGDWIVVSKTMLWGSKNQTPLNTKPLYSFVDSVAWTSNILISKFTSTFPYHLDMHYLCNNFKSPLHTSKTISTASENCHTMYPKLFSLQFHCNLCSLMWSPPMDMYST